MTAVMGAVILAILGITQEITTPAMISPSAKKNFLPGEGIVSSKTSTTVTS